MLSSKPLVWLRGEVKTPPFSDRARAEAGYLLRLLQDGERLRLPESRPMPMIGPNCHELRVVDVRKDDKDNSETRVGRSGAPRGEYLRDAEED